MRFAQPGEPLDLAAKARARKADALGAVECPVCGGLFWWESGKSLVCDACLTGRPREKKVEPREKKEEEARHCEQCGKDDLKAGNFYPRMRTVCKKCHRAGMRRYRKQSKNKARATALKREARKRRPDPPQTLLARAERRKARLGPIKASKRKR